MSGLMGCWLAAASTLIVTPIAPVTVTLAATEVMSGLARKQREGALQVGVYAVAKRRLAKLEAAWNEITQYTAVRARARRLLETHPLTAADALHLAAALVAVEERPTELGFVTLDARLAAAADKEGFPVFAG